MKISAFRSFVCPVDALPLFQKHKILGCDKGHVFDIAREGYCNLLLVQQKASLDPGDNKDMVASRRKFLDEGHFAQIANKVFEIVSTLVKKPQPRDHFRIVDAGCGEGYYLHQLSKCALANNQTVNLELAGCDISKWAVKAAAKRSADIAWAVAGNRQLPFAAGSVDLILSIFSFPDWKNFKTVQTMSGYVLMVDPGPEHLVELRQIIYPEVKENVGRSLNKAKDNGYNLEQEVQLKYSVTLESHSSIQDLLAMTPHAFRITQKAREKLETLKQLSLTVDVKFRVLQRKS